MHGVSVVQRQGNLEFETSLSQAKREREKRRRGRGWGGRVVGRARRMGLSISTEAKGSTLD